MSVMVTFECGDCDRAVTVRAESRFVSLTGRDHGFGSRVPDSIPSLAPEGWVAFDPFTGCCYCPECWDHISGGAR